MIIAEVHEKCKILVSHLVIGYKGIPRDVFIIGVLILVALLSFGLGYLAGIDAGQVAIVPLTESPFATSVNEGQVVTSKNGTKYYFAECAGASRISKENQVWFATDRIAISAGYTLAANCKAQ